MDIAVTGSTGLIGSALMGRLAAAGHHPIALVRRQPTGGADEIKWDISTGEIDAESLDGIDAVVHLAGAGIGDRRWNDAYRRELVKSRTAGTALLASTMAGLNSPPKAFISGSAIGFYGNRDDDIVDEESKAGEGFLPDLVVKWEASAQMAIDAGIRTCFARTGIVLSSEGGALKKMLPMFKVGLGGRFGSGRQWMSWISLEDQVNALLHLVESDLSGPVNLTAPEQVRNADFATTLGSVLKRPAVLPVPAFGPRLLLGTEMANALLFDSTRVNPTRLIDDPTFTFRHPDLESGLRSVLTPNASEPEPTAQE